jgi:CxxC motif-containing protein
MKELVCIICPVGCSLLVDDDPIAADILPAISVSGNRCPRGTVYAQEEVRSPRRVVTATCAIKGVKDNAPHRVPVKTSVPCPKEKIPALLSDIYATSIVLPLKAGDTVIADWGGTGIDVIATRTIV